MAVNVKAVVLALAASMTLAGCGTLGVVDLVEEEVALAGSCGGFMVTAPDGTPIRGGDGAPVTVADANGRVTYGYVRAMATGQAGIAPFLDCALEPAITEEARFYRGHVVVSLLAVYAAYNLEVGNYEQRIDDALAVLAQIEKAERALRGMSGVVSPDLAVPPYQGRPLLITQVIDVLELALDAERPSARRVGSDVRSLVGAISAGSPVGVLEQGLSGAMRGILKSITLRLYGKAYLADAREDLARFTGARAQPTAQDWANRDAMINTACERIAAVAGVAVQHCIPE